MSDLKIQINSKTAVDKLIDADAGFQVEIKNAIINAMTKNAEAKFQSDAQAAFSKSVQDRFFKNLGSEWNPKLVFKDKKKIDNAVEFAISSVVEKEVMKQVAAYDFEKAINETLEWKISEEVDRRVVARLNKAISNLD